MNKVLIVDATDSDRRLMSGLLTRAAYEPIAVDSMEAAKAMKYTIGIVQELINRHKTEKYKW